MVTGKPYLLTIGQQQTTQAILADSCVFVLYCAMVDVASVPAVGMGDRGGVEIAAADCETTEPRMLKGFDTLITEERTTNKSSQSVNQF